VKIFKAADEPQTTALAKELSKAGSSNKQTPEEMHALNMEDRRECSRCKKFGKDECWTHSPIKCAVCKKKGKTCPCVKKQAKQAEATRGAESPDPPAPMEGMMATMMQQSFSELERKIMEKVAARQEEAPMAERKVVGFDESEVDMFATEMEGDGLKEEPEQPAPTKSKMAAIQESLFELQRKLEEVTAAHDNKEGC